MQDQNWCPVNDYYFITAYHINASFQVRGTLID